MGVTFFGTLQGKNQLFGKDESNDIPVNNDIITFDDSTQQWILISGIIGNAVQSSSNVGSGAGLALPRVLDDLPFKTLVDGVEIVIGVTATELSFSIGAIAISKITGLQVELDSKIETITNVGGFKEIAKAKVGQNVDLRTLKEGTNITITQNANDLEIASLDTGEANTASNVGTGEGTFKQKVGVNLEFKSLLANLEILIANNVNDLAFSIGAIAQSKITGLVTALASKVENGINIGTGAEVFSNKAGVNLRFRRLIDTLEILIVQNTNDIAFNIGAIAQSKITNLVSDLATKFDTVVNVGAGVGLIFRNAVGTTINLRSLIAGTNITIVNNADDITISSTDTGEANTASNVGTGEGVFKQKVGVDLEFKSLLANLEILITSNVSDLAFSIGAIAQSKITGLVSDLASKIETITNIGGASEIAKAKVGTNVDLRTLLANAEILITTNVSDLAFSIGAIAQSKITNLVSDLATKFDTVVNVGTGVGKIFRDITTGTTINLKSLLAGTGITIVNNADDITISASGGGTSNTFDRVVKKVDETVNNSTVLQDDDELFSTLAINKTYFFQLIMLYNAGVVPEIKYAFTVPAGATIEILDDDRWDSGGNRPLKDGTVATPIGADGINEAMAVFGRVIMGGTAGDLTFQFAQVVSSGADTTVLQGSALIVWEEK